MSERTIQHRKRLESVLASVQLDYDVAENELCALQAAQGVAQHTVLELSAVDKVLSLTGVRAQLLSESLAGIETIANTWIGRIAGWGMRLELKPYAEKANGTVRDAISLEVHGAGGGHGYLASSGGERRRIDVAMLLALSEVASAAHGVNSKPSTVFVDEAFDALDTSGVDAVCEVLNELSADRCVVVITHSDLIRSAVGACKHLHVSAGSIQEVVGR